MQAARALLPLVTFGLTSQAYAMQRELAAGKAMEKAVAATAAQCVQKGQDSSPACSKPGVQLAIAKEKGKVEAFKAQVDPAARLLAEARAKEAAAAHTLGRASIGDSVVIKHNWNAGPTAQPTPHVHHYNPAPVHQPARPSAYERWQPIAQRITERAKL